MASVFVLQHVHSQEDGVEDVKFVGVYSSREKAEAAVARLSRLPGFADAPDGSTSTSTVSIRISGLRGTWWWRARERGGALIRWGGRLRQSKQ